MAIKPYLNIETSPGFQIFEFDSTGKDHLKKRVRFDLIDEAEQIYNLALCTVLHDGLKIAKHRPVTAIWIWCLRLQPI